MDFGQLRKMLRVLCSYFSLAFIVAKRTLLIKMVISLFKTKNLKFYKRVVLNPNYECRLFIVTE